jgi:hypothetical protein
MFTLLYHILSLHDADCCCHRNVRKPPAKIHVAFAA